MKNILHWHIYMQLRGRTISEKLANFSLFGPSLIHQLRLLGFQHQPQSTCVWTSAWFVVQVGLIRLHWCKIRRSGGPNLFILL
jgi:hypothetical protein